MFLDLALNSNYSQLKKRYFPIGSSTFKIPLFNHLPLVDPLSEAPHGIAPAAACIKEPSLYVLAAISVAYFLAFQCAGKCERKSRDFSLQLQLQQLQQQELLSTSLSNQATCCTRFTNGPWPGSHCVRVCRCV